MQCCKIKCGKPSGMGSNETIKALASPDIIFHNV